jgi:acyl-CoA thioesterase-2
VTGDSPDPFRRPPEGDTSLEHAMSLALDALLHALALEPAGDDRFRVAAEPGRFAQVFGGQLVAQALLAASATVVDKQPHSLHAYFVAAGVPEQQLDLAVDRVRDGRSVSTRRVTVGQGERSLLMAMASFHTNPPSPEIRDRRPRAPDPEEVPRLQDWARAVPPEWQDRARSWIEQPPPLDIRIGEPPTFLGGGSSGGERSHWMRLPGDVGDDPDLHAALLAYASDYLLLDMGFRSHPEPYSHQSFIGVSLDHAIWFHRPVRFDRWHLHTQETVAFAGHRGLVRGAIHDLDGNLVASAMQEVLVRPR